jgi:hypothetical protein
VRQNSAAAHAIFEKDLFGAGYGEFLFGLLTLGNRMPQDAPSFQRVGFEVSLFLFFRLVFYQMMTKQRFPIKVSVAS